ncbi:hypothetical protein B0H10DRAFT_2190086 [Mycena sp. CBHHK59/15]|nr:hypothetical protein B0H10DRAFT_2190086 [Mycena sp. CBHHK59/15]
MVNASGANGHYNGTRPPADVLELALHDYARKSLSLAQRLDYLLKDFGYKISFSALKSLNRKFKVQTVKKPPLVHIASTLIAEVITNNVSSRNGPQTIQNQISRQDGIKIPRDMVRRLVADIDPDGAEARFPGRRRQPKQPKFKALRMGPVGIDIYGSRCHSSSKMIKFLVVPNARCSSTVGHYYLDLVEENGVFVQATVDDSDPTWQTPAIRFSPNYICDFPERFGLIKFGEPVPQHVVDALRQNIPKSWEECYRWVSDEFDTKALEVYGQMGVRNWC